MADLFPKRQTLSDEYHTALPESAAWEGLAAEGYVRLGPLFRTRRRGISFIPDEPLPASDDKKVRHVTKDRVEVSALAYFENDGAGLDAVRRSKSRAMELLLFIANYVLEAEPNALDPVTGECECSRQHRYYPCHWLIPMSERRWVPLGDNKQAAATAESIAQLFQGQEERLSELTGGRGKYLLEALGISMADLTLRAMAPDEDTRISLIGSVSSIMRAIGNDVEKVKLLADEISERPDLLDELQELRDRREMVRRNQSIGEQVEKFLEEILSGSAVKVTRTGVGSDFEVTEDYLQDGKEVLLVLEAPPGVTGRPDGNWVTAGGWVRSRPTYRVNRRRVSRFPSTPHIGLVERGRVSVALAAGELISCSKLEIFPAGSARLSSFVVIIRSTDGMVLRHRRASPIPD